MNIYKRTNDLEEALHYAKEIGKDIAKFVGPQDLSTLMDKIQDHMQTIPNNASRRLIHMYDIGLLEGLRFHLLENVRSDE